MKILKYIFDNIEEWCSGFFFCLMSIAVATQIITRFTGTSFMYTEEIARYSYIWVAFFCMSMAEKRRAHFNVIVFTIFLKGRGEAALEFIADLICAFVFIYLFYWSIRFIPFNHVNLSPAMRIPLTCISASLTVGFFLSFIRRSYHAVGHVKQIAKGVSP